MPSERPRPKGHRCREPAAWVVVVLAFWLGRAAPLSAGTLEHHAPGALNARDFFPPPPGRYYAQYNYYYHHTDKFVNAEGATVPLDPIVSTIGSLGG